MKVRVDNFSKKDVKTVDEFVVQYDEQPMAIILDPENYRNSLNLIFNTIDEAKQVRDWLSKGIEFWESSEE